MTAEPEPRAGLSAPPAELSASPAWLASQRRQFWLRALRGWDVAFYLMVVIAAVALVLDTRGPALAAVLALLAALTAAYAAVGHRAARTGDRRLALVYVVLLVVVTVVIVRISPIGSILLFVAYSQIWFFSESRRAGVVASVLLTVGITVATVAHEGPDSANLPETLAQGALALAFAVLLGLWITEVAEQSEERAELLARLGDAQAELGRTHHAAGVAAERERMAREIHDTLAQGFTSIVMLAQTAASDVRRGEPERAAERMALVEQTARDNLAEARALVAAFAPVGLDGATLGQALGRLAARFEQETGVQVEVVLPDDATEQAIGRDREVILLRAAQEALANVRRHADARHVQLVLVGDPDGTRHGSIALEVVDDGRGIDPAAAEGFGLRGMRERVTSGGGELAVSGGAAGGTRVRVSLPAEARQPEHRNPEPREGTS